MKHFRCVWVLHVVPHADGFDFFSVEVDASFASFVFFDERSRITVELVCVAQACTEMYKYEYDQAPSLHVEVTEVPVLMRNYSCKGPGTSSSRPPFVYAYIYSSTVAKRRGRHAG